MVLDIFKKVFRELDQFILQENNEAKKNGALTLPKQNIKIAGQTALLLTQLPFPVHATMDLDVVSKIDYKVQKKLSELLLEQGLQLECDGQLIWMPPNTDYKLILDYQNLEVFIADDESVIASKYKFKRPKDQKIIQTYLNYFPERVAAIKLKAEK